MRAAKPSIKNKLWGENTPQKFWLCQSELSWEQWEQAVHKALPLLEMDLPDHAIDTLLEHTLGEAQFGEDHWSLSPTRRLYYELKPFVPSMLRYLMRRAHSHHALAEFQLKWPIEDRFVLFQWEILRQLEHALKPAPLRYQNIWPNKNRFALVLVHDVESSKGLEKVRELADLEEKHGFHSCFFFVPEAYSVEASLLKDLRGRGFEVGIHGLKHDGKLFKNKSLFMKRVRKINQYLKEFGANGFSAPLTHRNPEWMQALDVDYDNSFFDTDPFEPLPGGSMSIWPFKIGRFVELPHTMLQDSTLFYVLGEQTSRLWKEKLDFIERYHGMALLKTHPDYLQEARNQDVYTDFLAYAKRKNEYWHALPSQVAAWWRRRAGKLTAENMGNATEGLRSLDVF